MNDITLRLEEQDIVQLQIILCRSLVEDIFLSGIDHIADGFLNLCDLIRQASAAYEDFVLLQTFVNFDFDFHGKLLNDRTSLCKAYFHAMFEIATEQYMGHFRFKTVSKDQPYLQYTFDRLPCLM